MGKNSAIEWTDHTFNPWWGCSKVSEGCKNCYAATLANRYGHDVWGKDKGRRFLSESYWKQPARWNQHALNKETRAKVFVGSMCDVFESYAYDGAEVPKARIKLGKAIKETPYLDWLLLTKRPENITGMASSLGWVTNTGGFMGEWDIPSNVWLGVSVENQEMADKRIPLLLEIPAIVHFVSCEPLLGEISLENYMTDQEHGIDWVIAGPESGSKNRPMEISWAESLRHQCSLTWVPFFMKGHKVMDIPAEIDIQEFPNV